MKGAADDNRRVAAPGTNRVGQLDRLVVVLAGVLSALAAIAKLTLWVSLLAAFAAVLGGLRVIRVRLLIPARLETVKMAVAQIGDDNGPRGSAVTSRRSALGDSRARDGRL